ncbi:MULTISPECIES: hypothetical protein [unclassified Actinotignum]|uniref:hypothetical protein n=1 Tax=unclassified Actinotignum TaxID=2632702 RepID=UPI002A82E482|nr:hypothetical protein [Actinotignum sp. SLA_B059]MDY5127453.1 hypothetical protein [Actinotignum sp. SLA_B059]
MNETEARAAHPAGSDQLIGPDSYSLPRLDACLAEMTSRFNAAVVHGDAASTAYIDVCAPGTVSNLTQKQAIVKCKAELKWAYQNLMIALDRIENAHCWLINCQTNAGKEPDQLQKSYCIAAGYAQLTEGLDIAGAGHNG